MYFGSGYFGLGYFGTLCILSLGILGLGILGLGILSCHRCQFFHHRPNFQLFWLSNISTFRVIPGYLDALLKSCCNISALPGSTSLTLLAVIIETSDWFKDSNRFFHKVSDLIIHGHCMNFNGNHCFRAKKSRDQCYCRVRIQQFSELKQVLSESKITSH